MRPGARSLEAKITRRFAPFAALGFLALLAPLIPPRNEAELVARADTALYEAKGSGRDALVTSSVA
jgi:GGDEF domain-containing protein